MNPISLFALIHVAMAPTSTVRIHPQATISPAYRGMAVQIDPFFYEPSRRQWTEIWRRLDRLQPGYIRVSFQADAYCEGFDASGTPVYAWKTHPNSKKLAQIYAILDYAQRRGIEVLLGEWGFPKLGEVTIQAGDARWPRVIADWVSHLVRERKYTCIRDFDFFNEPNGDWSGNKSYADWRDGLRRLARAFAAKGLDRQIRISAPSTTGNSRWMEGLDWLEKTAQDLCDIVSSYNAHWYALDAEVVDGSLGRVLRQKREAVLAIDPAAQAKPFFMGESGIVEGRINNDQQPRVKTFPYGVLMADYVCQVTNAGWLGADYWDMDDAMHPCGPETVPPGPLTLKVWGFWNSQGEAMGNPRDFDLRPPFYVWSLLSRTFARGTRIVQADVTGGPIRAMAGVDDRNHTLSVALVNDTDQPCTVEMDAEAFGRRQTFEYRYFDRERPVDGEGYAVAAEIHGPQEKHFRLSFPARGCIFLTSKALPRVSRP